jgi:hypothetical protein
MSPLPERFSHVVPLRVNPAERLYAARDTVLDRDVWVKLPGGDVTGWSAPVRERLLREAKALAKVRHRRWCRCCGSKKPPRARSA